MDPLRRASTEGLRALGLLLGRADVEVSVDAELTDDPAHLLNVETTDEQAVAIAFELIGGVNGGLVLFLPANAANLIVSGLVREAPGVELTTLSEKARGALAEAGNIVVSAFLNVLAAVVGRACLPSVPHLAAGPARAAVDEALRELNVDFGAAGQAVLLTARTDLGVALEVRLGVVPPLRELSVAVAPASH